MGPGVDPHLYKPTSRDSSSLAKADLIVFHGLLLEGRMAQALEQADRRGITSVAATSEIPKTQLLHDGEESEDGIRIRMFGFRLKFGRFASTL